MEWNIGKIISKRAQLTPEKVAFTYEDNPISYGHLNKETNRTADYFQSIGLKKGDRISVDLLNCPEFLAIYFAASKLGLIFIPLNCRMVSGELEYQLNNCGSRLLIFNDVFSKLIDPIRSSVKVDSDKFICLQSGTTEDFACPEWAVDFKDAVDGRTTTEPTASEPINLDDPLVIIYTSGVTGQPKGAVLSHAQTFFKCFQIMMYTDMREDDVFLSQLPLFHSGGLFIVASPVLCRGASFIMRKSFEPEQFAGDINKYRPTVIFALTTMWRFILKADALDKVDVSCVRIVLGGGERTPSSLLRDLESYGLNMQQGFGQTENSAMMILPKQDILRKEGSIGLPGFFTDIWIEDDAGNKLPPGEVGEIVAQGPTVMSGYWNMPEKTAETIVDDRLFTGDLGYMDEEGYFYIVDRAKDMYRSGGENVYPAEIEKVLVNHPDIENAVIIGIPDETWGETGKAFVVPEKGKTITIEMIRKFLSGKVAKYKFPSVIEIVSSLPMTATGKIKKSDLKEQYLTN